MLCLTEGCQDRAPWHRLRPGKCSDGHKTLQSPFPWCRNLQRAISGRGRLGDPPPSGSDDENVIISSLKADKSFKSTQFKEENF